MEATAAEILGIACRMRCNKCLADHKMQLFMPLFDPLRTVGIFLFS